MSASPTPFASKTAASRAEVSGLRGFFRDVWQSYLRHSELRVMLSSGRWTPEAEAALRRKSH